MRYWHTPDTSVVATPRFGPRMKAVGRATTTNVFVLLARVIKLKPPAYLTGGQLYRHAAVPLSKARRVYSHFAFLFALLSSIIIYSLSSLMSPALWVVTLVGGPYVFAEEWAIACMSVCGPFTTSWHALSVARMWLTTLLRCCVYISSCLHACDKIINVRVTWVWRVNVCGRWMHSAVTPCWLIARLWTLIILE